MESPILETFPELDVVDAEPSVDLSRSALSEVQTEFLAHQFATERQRWVKVDYTKHQSELTKTIRKTVVDWMVQVQQRLRANTSNLHWAVALMDRFLSVRQCPKSKIQLVAVACMYLADTHNESYAVGIADFVYMTARSYSVQSISKTCEIVLAAVDYKLLCPTIFYFVDIYLGHLPEVKKRTRALVRYFAEQSLLDLELLRQHRPSELAFASLYLANRWGKQKLNLRPVRRITGYSGRHQRQCIGNLEASLRTTCNSDENAIRKKYAKTTKNFTFPDES
jgi:transcription initiation factor TFIIIB Brf1 subunit/transcription initiation factor TFIIB